jgi:hypothetical protein
MLQATLTARPRIGSEDELLSLAVIKGMIRLGCKPKQK